MTRYLVVEGQTSLLLGVDHELILWRVSFLISVSHRNRFNLSLSVSVHVGSLV